jgi:hypothetical protein
MLSDTCKAILVRHAEMKGRKEVISELGISSTTLSQVLADKYGAATDAIETKIMKIYGNDGLVACPERGQIEPAQCAANYRRAQRKTTAGNPATIRLFLACRKCDFRG